jgi:hypothetical protein
MPITEAIVLFNSGSGNVINSTHFTGFSLTAIEIYDSGTGHSINLNHLVEMPLTLVRMYKAGTNNSGELGSLRTQISTIDIGDSGNNINVTNNLKSWNSTNITVYGGYFRKCNFRIFNKFGSYCWSRYKNN